MTRTNRGIFRLLIGATILGSATLVAGAVSGPGQGAGPKGTAAAAMLALPDPMAAATSVARSLSLSNPSPDSDSVLWSVRFARSVVQRSPVVHEKWDYTAGVMLDAIDRVATATHDTVLAAYVTRNLDRLIQPDGTILTYDRDELSLDQIEEGRIALRLWTRTGDVRYRKAVETLRDQLRRMPRTSEGGFWHKNIYPQQMWLDGIYMAGPFYAGYGRAFGEPAAYDDVARQIRLVAGHTRDPRSGLYRHGWDAARKQIWADKRTGLSPNFWGRGLGWYAMALVDVLDVLPARHPERPRILRLLRELAPAIARVQDPASGLWYQVLDQPGRAGNYHEASASSMFVYTLAKGARRGWLPARYLAVARRGFDGIVRELVRANADGTVSLTGVCSVAGLGGRQQRDGSYEYYIHEPVVSDDYKGVGPFVMAALELGR